MKNAIRYSLLLLCLQLGVANLYASTEGISQLTHETEGITYANGGVGEGEREDLKAARKDFNLQLTFAKKGTGEFVADVEVEIETVKGKGILELSNMGPLFLAQLEPGKYRIKVTRDDKEQTKTISVSKRGIRDLYFYW